MGQHVEAEVDQELRDWADRGAEREARAQTVAVPPIAPLGHVLVTEPQGLVLARQEQIDREYEELAEAWER